MTDNIISISISLLIAAIKIAGMLMFFPKCNIKKFWAFVPIANTYKLAICADEEDAGIVLCMTRFIRFILFTLLQMLDILSLANSTSYAILYVLALVFYIISFIYSIRIYSEMCRVFAQKRSWLPLWIIAEGICLIIWGYSKNIQPEYVVNVDDDNTVVGNNLVAHDEGLTINIRKRTARKSLFITKVMLKDIHIDIKPGSMVLLLGGSGAGKTTFINAVTGYEKADATVTLNGNDVYRDFDKVIYDIGVVPQQDLIRNTDTVLRTLMDAAALRMPTDVGIIKRRNRVEEVMEMFGLSSIKNNMISKQSGGQKKRISIATEYISDPSLFILDEPDSGLDGILARELMQKLHDISREGKIVIVVTHTPDRVIDMFDQVIVLAKDKNRTGRLVFFGEVDEAKKFFEKDSMEEIVKTINKPDEGGEGRADEFVEKYAEVLRANE